MMKAKTLKFSHFVAEIMSFYLRPRRSKSNERVVEKQFFKMWSSASTFVCCSFVCLCLLENLIKLKVAWWPQFNDDLWLAVIVSVPNMDILWDTLNFLNILGLASICFCIFVLLFASNFSDLWCMFALICSIAVCLSLCNFLVYSLSFVLDIWSNLPDIWSITICS